MDVGLLWVPLGVMGAAGLMVAALSWGSSRVTAFPAMGAPGLLRPGVWAAALGLLVLTFVAQLGVVPGLSGFALGTETLALLCGVAMLSGAGALTWRANRLRRSAELAISSEPLSLDQAVERARATGKPVQGIFRGRIASDEVVTSPSGVVCAFYASELRAGGAVPDRKGPLVSSERGFGTTLWLKGERVTASVSFHPELLRAPEEIRRCTVFSRMTAGLRGAIAEGELPEEVTAFERIGRLGDACYVVGELRAGPVSGGWEIRGAGSGPAPVVVGVEPKGLGGSALKRAVASFAAAVALCIGAAWLLASFGPL